MDMRHYSKQWMEKKGRMSCLLFFRERERKKENNVHHEVMN